MSVCGQSGQPEDDSASEEVGVPATRDIYKQKPASKLVRVLTVLAYLLSVSLAAILLSVYYICVWKSPELPKEVPLGTGEVSARRAIHTDHRYAEHAEHATQASDTYGGGDTAVNGGIIHSPLENITSGITEDSVATAPTTESTTDATLNATALPDTTPGLHNGTSDYGLNNTDSIT